jgi:hypothetical protein
MCGTVTPFSLRSHGVVLLVHVVWYGASNISEQPARLPWGWKQQIPSNCLHPSTQLRDVTSHDHDVPRINSLCLMLPAASCRVAPQRIKRTAVVTSLCVATFVPTVRRMCLARRCARGTCCTVRSGLNGTDTAAAITGINCHVQRKAHVWRQELLKCRQ